MKKITFLFVSLLLLIVTGCSNDDEYQNGKSSENRAATQVRWYGVKELTGTVQTRGATDRMKLWAQDPIITVKFLNNPDDPALVEQIKSYAKEWEQYAGVTFQFEESTETALVRIGFDWEGNSWLTWSYTGNDAKMVRSQSEPTAVFGGFNDGYMTDEEIRADVLRVFGQVLGLEFEQRHGDWDASWWKVDKNGVYYAQSYWESMFEDYYENFDWETIRQYVFDPLAGATIVQTDEVDLESIMIWPYYTRKETTTLLANYDLSEKDKEFIATLYPKKEGNTIQIAWVDAGYFVWVNEEKTQLRITAKGAAMEELPDVVDGEQLTSASYMFLNDNYTVYSSLKKAPKFNTCNIVDFTYMFSRCPELEEVPLYNTSKGQDFRSMFMYCDKLASVPLFDTSSGTNFLMMFAFCYNLVEVPLFDTSQGVSFGTMFYMCERLSDIPHFDTSKGRDFSEMFKLCTGLASVPLFDVSNGQIFGGMFWGCANLVDVPLLDTSQGTNFTGMFYDCTSLTDIPHFNTSNGTNFGSMFRRCLDLETIPAFDTANGTYFQDMFLGCIKLKSVPPLDITKGILFTRMFYGANLLEEVELKGFGQGGRLTNREEIDFTSSVLNLSSLEFLVNNASAAWYSRAINLSKALESQVPASLIAEAAAKNLTIQFIY